MGWEDPIRETCDKSREAELVHVRGIAVTKALMIAVVLGSSVIAAVVTFSGAIVLASVPTAVARQPCCRLSFALLLLLSVLVSLFFLFFWRAGEQARLLERFQVVHSSREGSTGVGGMCGGRQ